MSVHGGLKQVLIPLPCTPFLLSHPDSSQFPEPPEMGPVGFGWKAGVKGTDYCCSKVCTFMKKRWPIPWAGPKLSTGGHSPIVSSQPWEAWRLSFCLHSGPERTSNLAKALSLQASSGAWNKDGILFPASHMHFHSHTYSFSHSANPL